MPGQGLSICPLASGSRGNSIYVSGGGTAVLVDAGLSGVELQRRMGERGLCPETLSAVVVTHEHTDHVQSAGVLSRRYGIPVYINEKTCRAAQKKLGNVDRLVTFECGRGFSIGELSIQPFSVSHDAEDPVGLTLQYQNKKVGIATDMGVATGLVRESLKECSLLYLEANHDPDMLMNGPYPWYLKQRVKSRRGHLSNLDAGILLQEIRSACLRHVILAHLSQENNTPEKALQAIQSALDCRSISLDVAMPDTPGAVVEL